MLGTSGRVPGSSGRARRASKERRQPAAMCGAARGEPIARSSVSSHVRERIGARTLRGLPQPAAWLARQSEWGEAETDRDSGAGRVRREAGR